MNQMPFIDPLHAAHLRQLQNGDVVYALVTIVNDGSVPHVDEGEVFALSGTMGMLLNTGYMEGDPNMELYLVSFRDAEGELGPPVTCLANEIGPEPVALS